MVYDHRLCRAVLGVFVRALFGFEQRRARVDVVASVNSHGAEAAGAITFAGDLGNPAGAGSAILQIPTSVVHLASNNTAACGEMFYPDPVPFLFTTAQAQGRITEPRQGGDGPVFSQVGAPFSCPGWRVQGGATLVTPVFEFDVLGVLDIPLILRLVEASVPGR